MQPFSVKTALRPAYNHFFKKSHYHYKLQHKKINREIPSSIKSCHIHKAHPIIKGNKKRGERGWNALKKLNTQKQ